MRQAKRLRSSVRESFSARKECLRNHSSLRDKIASDACRHPRRQARPLPVETRLPGRPESPKPV